MQDIHLFIPFRLEDIYLINLKYYLKNDISPSQNINIKDFAEHEKLIHKIKDAESSYKFSCNLIFLLKDKKNKKDKKTGQENNHIFIFRKNVLKENLNDIKTVVPNIYQPIIDIGDDYLSFECFVYDEDNYFGKHINTKRDKNHFATMLIFPPIDLLYFHSGGVLKIWDREGKIHEFYSSKNKEWTFIIFQTNLEYEFTPIIEGKQIIFKKNLYYIKELYELLTYPNKINNPELLIETNTRNQCELDMLSFYRERTNINFKKLNNLIDKTEGEKLDEMNEINSTIQKVRKNLKSIGKIINTKYENICAHNLKNIIEDEDTESYLIIIYVFRRYYWINQTNQKIYLSNNDLNFFNEVKNIYPLTYLRNFVIELNENLKEAKFFNELWEIELNKLLFKKIKIIYQEENSKKEIYGSGNFINSIEIDENNYDNCGNCDNFHILLGYTTIIIPKIPK